MANASGGYARRRHRHHPTAGASSSWPFVAAVVVAALGALLFPGGSGGSGGSGGGGVVALTPCPVYPAFTSAQVHAFSAVMGTIGSCSLVPRLCGGGCATSPHASDAAARAAANAQLLGAFYAFFQTNASGQCWGPDGYIADVAYVVPGRDEFLRAVTCEGRCRLDPALPGGVYVRTCLTASFVSTCVLALAVLPACAAACGCTRAERRMAHKLDAVRAGQPSARLDACCTDCYCPWTTDDAVDQAMAKPDVYDPELLDTANEAAAAAAAASAGGGGGHKHAVLSALYAPLMDAAVGSDLSGTVSSASISCSDSLTLTDGDGIRLSAQHVTGGTATATTTTTTTTTAAPTIAAVQPKPTAVGLLSINSADGEAGGAGTTTTTITSSDAAAAAEGGAAVDAASLPVHRSTASATLRDHPLFCAPSRFEGSPAPQCCTWRWVRPRLVLVTQWDYRTDRDPLQNDWSDAYEDLTYPAPACASLAWWTSLVYVCGFAALRTANSVVAFETGTSAQLSLVVLGLGVDLSNVVYCAVRRRAFAGVGSVYNALHTLVTQRKHWMVYTKVQFHVDGHAAPLLWCVAKSGALWSCAAVLTSFLEGLYDTDVQAAVGAVSFVAGLPTAVAVCVTLVLSVVQRLLVCCWCVPGCRGRRSRLCRSDASYRTRWTAVDECFLQYNRTVMALF